MKSNTFRSFQSLASTVARLVQQGANEYAPSDIRLPFCFRISVNGGASSLLVQFNAPVV
jgi:hypothetical protein